MFSLYQNKTLCMNCCVMKTMLTVWGGCHSCGSSIVGYLEGKCSFYWTETTVVSVACLTATCSCFTRIIIRGWWILCNFLIIYSTFCLPQVHSVPNSSFKQWQSWKGSSGLNSKLVKLIRMSCTTEKTQHDYTVLIKQTTNHCVLMTALPQFALYRAAKVVFVVHKWRISHPFVRAKKMLVVFNIMWNTVRLLSLIATSR